MIDILMATYNGECYVKEQIESIISQTFTNWRLIIRDDGSSDKTVDIIRTYCKRYENKIFFIEDGGRNLGVKLCFNELLKYSTSQYIMFCDQDDVWKRDKIEVTFKEMQLLEKKYSTDIPLLIHTDLVVVDKKLKTICPSLWILENINPNKNKLNNLLCRNTVTGCTMMINMKLKEFVKEIPDECIMHDNWFAIVATVFGKISFLSNKTILYRQHENNTLGAIINDKKNKRFTEKFNNYTRKKIFGLKMIQAKCFLDMYNAILLPKDKFIIGKFLDICETNVFNAKRNILKYDFYLTHTLKEKIKLIIFLR